MSGTVERRVSDVLERFLDKIEVVGEHWLWIAGTNGVGYGAFYVDNVQGVQLAHRFSFDRFVGPIPQDHEVDHTCHNNDPTCTGFPECFHRRCVRPMHLEAVTHQENNARSHLMNGRKTHCIHGHEFTPENTYLRLDGLGKRQCRACSRERKQAARHG